MKGSKLGQILCADKGLVFADSVTIQLVTYIVISHWYFLLEKQISGGKITLLAKYNSIQVFNEVYDACYLVKQLGRQCPIPAGVLYSHRVLLT